MNVLVYSGPGTTPASVKHAIDALRLILSSNYAVSAVSERLIQEQPWESKTAVLVIPGGADLPICKLFNGETNLRISNFVRKGGKYIGFCSGGYYGSARCEFEVGDPTMEVSGARELKFYPGTCRGSAIKGFEYNSEIGAKAVQLKVNQSALPGLKDSVISYLNGGGVFVDSKRFRNVEVLASFQTEIDVEADPDGYNAAVVLSTFGRGKALLTGPHIEFSPDILKHYENSASISNIIEILKKADKDRLEFLRACLIKLGLKVNEKELDRPSLTPLFLTSFNTETATNLVQKLEHNNPYNIQNIMDLGHDKFRIHKNLGDFDQFKKGDSHEDADLAIKDLYVCGADVPPLEDTPYFDIREYQACLKQFYTETDHTLDKGTLTGENFVYGEVLTSTSALMDSNHQLLRNLPDGFTIYGTTQVLGKGRSGNYWVNPRGVLAVSHLVRMQIEKSKLAPVVFFQYISAMAYTKAILSYSADCHKIPIKIKWPNDIYIMLPECIGKKIDSESQEVTHAKIGGILVNTNLIDKEYYLIIGAGLNVGNQSPTTSLNKVVDAINRYYGDNIEHYKPEKLIAKYLSIFNDMVEKFKIYGFEPFLKEYYDLWFHTDQIVTMYDQAGVKAKIIGITPDWGMLLARELNPMGKPTGNVFQLQPDGNSFDMFRGLISKKR